MGVAAAVRLPSLLVLAYVISALTRAVVRRVLDPYDGLQGLVSFSSRLIAAARALESARPDRLFEDPLAPLLAGGRAVREAKRRALLLEEQAQQRNGHGRVGDAAAGAAGEGAERSVRIIARIVARTLFFDDALAAALHLPCSPLMLAVQRACAPCKQVVLLGAGMDSRAWRCSLPSGTAWFEVDQADVLEAKQKLLERAGVPMVPGQKGRGKYAVELQAARWSCRAADLQVPGWCQALQSSGLDAQQPVMWVVEGLLYYLEPDTVPAMLKEAAANCAPGSVLVASLVVEGPAGLPAQQARTSQDTTAPPASLGGTSAQGASGVSTQSVSGTGAHDASGTGAPAASGTSAPAASTTSRTDARAPAGTGEGGSPLIGASSGAGPGAGVLQGAQAPAAGGARGRQPWVLPGHAARWAVRHMHPPPLSRLMGAFKWRCPQNVEQFFAEQGWAVQLQRNCAEVPGEYGHDTTMKSHDSTAVYLVAVKLASSQAAAASAHTA